MDWVLAQTIRFCFVFFFPSLEHTASITCIRISALDEKENWKTRARTGFMPYHDLKKKEKRRKKENLVQMHFPCQHHSLNK